MVTTTEPVAMLGSVFKVRIFPLKLGVMPEGGAGTLSATAPVKPPVRLTDMVKVVLEPRGTVWEVGRELIVKSPGLVL
jgi:hypothetical protein